MRKTAAKIQAEVGSNSVASQERLRQALADLTEKAERQALADKAVGQATRLREIALADHEDAKAAEIKPTLSAHGGSLSRSLAAANRSQRSTRSRSMLRKSKLEHPLKRLGFGKTKR